MVRDDARRANYALRRSLPGHNKSIAAVKFSVDGRSVASASADRTVVVWDVESGIQRCTLRGHSAGINDFAWSGDSFSISTASDDKTVQIFDVRVKHRSIKKLSGHVNYVSCVNYNTLYSNLIVSGSYDESVRIFDVRSGGTLKVLPAHADPVTSVDFSRDGKRLVSCSYDGNMRVWNAEIGKLMKTISGDNNTPVSNAQFTPNANYILAATLDNKLRLWDIKSQKIIKTYTNDETEEAEGLTEGGKGEGVASEDEDISIDIRGGGIFVNKRFCISPTLIQNNNASQIFLIATGSENGNIVIWDLQSKKIVQHIEKAHNDVVMGIDEHPTQSIIASASIESDPVVKIWGVGSAS